MPSYEIMAYLVDLPISANQPIAIPSGWEPIGTLARQGNKAAVLCRRITSGPLTEGTPK